MRQFLWTGLALAAMLGADGGSSAAYAQGRREPEPPPPQAASTAQPVGDSVNPDRLPGGAMPIVVTVVIIVLLMSWVGIGDWVNRDTQIFGFGYKKWNPIIFFPFAIVGLAQFFIPMPHWVRL